jgi:uncharacterized protein (DUF169 family)
MSETLKNLNDALMKIVKPSTFPVAVRVAKEGEELKQQFKRPVADLGNQMAACQGLNITRIFGWTLVFDSEDHACPLALVAAGKLDPDEFLSGAIADLYQDDPEAGGRMEASYPRQEAGEVEQIWLSTLERCEFDPHLAVVYGSPAQILVLIHAANYGRGEGIGSPGTGRFGCAAWIAGVVRSQDYQYMVPGSGERVFAGTQDHEMSFIIPRSCFESITQNLAIMRKKGTYRYPVPNMNILCKPDMPEKYGDLGKKGS